MKQPKSLFCPLHKRIYIPQCSKCRGIRKASSATNALFETFAPSTNKYRAKKSFLGKRHFPSQLERDAWAVLEFLQTQGIIKELTQYPTVDLVADIKWKVDMSAYVVKLSQTIFFEPKGKETEGYRLKLKLFGQFGPSPLAVIKSVDKYSFGIYETAIPPDGIKKGDPLKLGVLL